MTYALSLCVRFLVAKIREDDVYKMPVNVQMGMCNTAAVIKFLNTCTYFLKPYEYIERSLSVIEGFAALASIQINKSRNECRGKSVVFLM